MAPPLEWNVEIHLFYCAIWTVIFRSCNFRLCIFGAVVYMLRPICETAHFVNWAVSFRNKTKWQGFWRRSEFRHIVANRHLRRTSIDRYYCGLHYVVIGWPLYSAAVVSSYFFFSGLFSAVADWMSTILPHVMWP